MWKEVIVTSAFDWGFQNGLAGFGMALMTGLDGDDSWISLLPNAKRNEAIRRKIASHVGNDD